MLSEYQSQMIERFAQEIVSLIPVYEYIKIFLTTCWVCTYGGQRFFSCHHQLKYQISTLCSIIVSSHRSVDKVCSGHYYWMFN